MQAPQAARLNKMLNERFELCLDFGPSTDVTHLRAVMEHYVDKRALLRLKLGEAGTLESQEYAKAVLISEAVRLFLREIAPKRLRKKKR